MVFAISEWGQNYSLKDAITSELIFLPVRLISVYLTWFYFVPLLLYKRKNYLFLVSLVCVILILAVCQRAFQLYWAYPIFFSDWLNDGNIQFFKPTRILQNALIIFFPVALTSGWKLLIDYKQKREREAILEIEKKETELKYLKSQINPHFLFNTLNTLYSMALEGSKKVPEIILRLSEFLSFTLYETNQEFIELQKEVELIDNFIELQKDRFQRKVAVNFNINDLNGYLKVPPMILISFVENAFKHSMKDELGVAKINIDLRTEKDKIHFKVTNSKSYSTRINENNRGIGLNNIQRRLDLIYHDLYILDIRNGKEEFEISLTLNSI